MAVDGEEVRHGQSSVRQRLFASLGKTDRLEICKGSFVPETRNVFQDVGAGIAVRILGGGIH